MRFDRNGWVRIYEIAPPEKERPDTLESRLIERGIDARELLGCRFCGVAVDGDKIRVSTCSEHEATPPEP